MLEKNLRIKPNHKEVNEKPHHPKVTSHFLILSLGRAYFLAKSLWSVCAFLLPVLFSFVPGEGIGCLSSPLFLGFPGGSAGKESACSAGDPRLIPGSGRSPGEGKGFSLIFFLENHKESDTTE